MIALLQESSTRIKTALILFAVFITVSYINTLFVAWLFFGFFMIVGVHEAMKLFDVKDFLVYQIAIVTWIVAYFYNKPENLFFIYIIIFASRLAYSKKIERNAIFPLIYPLASFLFLLSLYHEYGISSLWWILAIVGSTDIGAYYVGKSIGTTKFCQTSPNKTLEGLFGGLIIGSLVGALFYISDIGYFNAIWISFLVSIASIFGDLFESYLKREAHVKDSGTLLPGHGGVLDRTDGFLFAAVVMLFLLRLVV